VDEEALAEDLASASKAAKPALVLIAVGERRQHPAA
jgi:hypothetical protein